VGALKTQDFAQRQRRNGWISAAIVFCFIVFFILVGLSVDYVYLDAFTRYGPPVPIATLSTLAFATFMALTAYNYGGSLILSSMGAEKLDIQLPEHREFHNVVTEMALASGCPMPRVYVVFDPAPNAFATGQDEKSSSICVTTGLLALLNREETQGVVAHEMAHIRNNDTLVMMLVSILLGGVALLADWAQRSFFSSRHTRRGANKNLIIVVPALLLIILSPLISRLMKIRDAGMPFHKASRGTAHLFIANPLRRRVDDREGRMADLLSTHPPINRRIMLLYQMAGLPGGEERVQGSKV